MFVYCNDNELIRNGRERESWMKVGKVGRAERPMRDKSESIGLVLPIYRSNVTRECGKLTPFVHQLLTIPYIP